MRVLAVVLCFASAAWAFKPGDLLWARDDGTPVFKEASEGKALFTLNAGEAVQWLGPSEKDRTFHLVKAHGQSGYVRFTSLTPNSPNGARTATFTAPPIQEQYGTKPSFPLGSDAARKSLADVEELNRQVAEKKN